MCAELVTDALNQAINCGNIETPRGASCYSTNVSSNLFTRGDNRFNNVTRLKTFVKLGSRAITNRKPKFISAALLTGSMTFGSN
jgi:hypothetical protein